MVVLRPAALLVALLPAALLVALLPAALLVALLPAACYSDSASSPAEEDSLEANPEFAEQETSLNKAYEKDPVLLERQTELDEAAAEEADAETHMAALDSLMAADPDFAERVEEVERLAGEDESLLDTHGEAMAYLEGHPEEAEALFAEEVEPTYTGSDPVMIAYVGYLAAHPPLYRAWWRVYHHLRIHPRFARSLYLHWRWYNPRARLWKASWAYKLRAARNARIHKIVWARRIYLGQHPRLARSIWHQRHHPHVTKPPLRLAKSHPKPPPPKRKPPKRRQSSR